MRVTIPIHQMPAREAFVPRGLVFSAPRVGPQTVEVQAVHRKTLAIASVKGQVLLSMNTAPNIIAHRGSSDRCHENTMAAFEQAVADGADGIEFDLRLTADGHWVVHHDATISVGGSPIRIASLTLDEISKFWVGSERHAIPTLTDFLQWAKRENMPLVFDIKDKGGIDTLIDTVEASKPRTSLVFSAFCKSVLLEIRDRRPKWKIALIVGNPRWRMMRRMLAGSLLRWARNHQLHALHLHERWVTPSLISNAHTSQINIAVWTVDDPVRIALLAHLGVDAIITNKPELARESLGTLAPAPGSGSGVSGGAR